MMMTDGRMSCQYGGDVNSVAAKGFYNYYFPTTFPSRHIYDNYTANGKYDISIYTK